MSPTREWKTEQEIRALVHDVVQSHPTIVAIDRRVGATEESVRQFNVSLDKKHADNRASIHELRGGQDTLMNQIHLNKSELVGAITDTKASLTASVSDLSSTVKGYRNYVGGGLAVGTVLLGLAYKILDHYWPK